MESMNEPHLPPGFRFHPTDEELITYYLIKKVLDSSFCCRAMAEVDLNKCEPWGLPERAKMGEKEWYFFSLRDRKYPTGLRTNRATEAGYWKATGKDREIYSSKTCSLVGMKKTLVFYRGRAPKGEKSNWVMHEYRLEGKLSYHYLSKSSKDEWVISRVFMKTGGVNNGGAGTRKSRLVCSNLYSDVGSPSSSSLPPLLDSNNNDTRVNVKEHVPCFSTCYNNNHRLLGGFTMDASQPSIINTSGDYQQSMMEYDGISAFPSLRSLQENLNLPFFFSSVAPMPSILAADDHKVNWFGLENQMQVGPTELDCMWT
ncbi:hypothetical protein GIB67_039216 [Kingdonia uniflora]|uniref:NAC domain-containing protein n=1 Tax=Kingdonia uniflora TaxID=39325 RepID=A0A7J7MLT3_9MAGN|nr:hypothetical protein GIB67_039216 [Kingdonia uniflora]